MFTFFFFCIHRLAGAALLAPAINYWWPGFPSNLTKEAYDKQLIRDQWVYKVAYYAPWLMYWWNTQKYFPGFSVITGEFKLSQKDLKIAYSLDEMQLQQVHNSFLLIYLFSPSFIVQALYKYHRAHVTSF